MRQLAAQTILPVHVEIVNFEGKEGLCDITLRYRTGYEKLRGKGYDLIAFIENDDWYSPQYLEYMLIQWEMHNCPPLFGTQYTIYYHLQLRAWFKMNHSERASAMNTFIKPDLDFTWCVDYEPYIDIHLWMHTKIPGVIIKPDRHYSMGMKHGTGLCGGRNHTNFLHRFKNPDKNFAFLQQHLDKPSFEFFSNYFNPHPEI